MWSGEDVIADLKDTTDDAVVIVNPIVAVPTGQGQIGFAPWSPILDGKDKDIEVTRKYVVYISDPQSDIIDQYKQMFSSIATPVSKGLIL